MNQNLLIIESGLSEKNYWKDLWRYRELFVVLAWRDVTVRYKQTVIGLLWALIQPLLIMAVFTVIFQKIANLGGNENTPYALMVLAGLLPWQFFSSALSGASNSLIGNSNLISKVYFPRLIVPASSVVVAFIDFLLSFLLLIILLIWYRYTPGWQIFTLPIFIGMAFLASLGPGLYITALNVKYRDFRYIIPFIIQMGLYVSPIGFSSSQVNDEWRLLFSLNPVVSVIDGFRWAILGSNFPIYWPGFILGWLVILIFMWLGIVKFRKMEKTFADII